MIVCMSRRICVELYNKIIKIKPEWHNDDDDKGVVKVIMSGSASDGPDWQKHIRNKRRRKAIQDRMKDPKDILKLVIVRDMWLTGFDSHPLHTMYIDKLMRGHTLMQAIARVNRVFKNKPGGLIVDYLGFASELKKALSNYTEDNRKITGIPQYEAVNIMNEKYEIVNGMFYGFNYIRIFKAKPFEKISIIRESIDFILKIEDGKDRFIRHVIELSKAFALAVPHPDAMKIRDKVGFFQAVKSGIVKTSITKGKTPEELDTAIKQIISKAIVTEEIIDIFDVAGIKKPDISILSDEFLSEIKDMKHKNLAVEVLKKLLNGEIKSRARRNLIQSRSFAEMLEKTIIKYQNRSIETVRVIEELIELAKRMREDDRRGEELNLTEEEVAFYDALEVNDSSVKVLGNEALSTIAQKLVETIRNNISIDWTLRENIRAKIRVLVKRILRKYGYPVDKQEQATKTILEQAELLCSNLVEVALII